MRRGRQQDQGVRAGRQPLGELGALAALGPDAALGDVLALIDHDDVPVGVFQKGPVVPVVLERVDRDDRLVEVVKGVLAGGQLLADALDAERIEPHQRDREATPELLLELPQHALGGDHQQPPPAPAANQFAAEDAALQRLAQAHRIGDQQPLAGHRQRLSRWQQLVIHHIHRRSMADHQLGPCGHRAAQVSFDEQQAVTVVVGAITHQLGVLRFQHLEVWLQRFKKQSRLLLQIGRDPHHIQQALPLTGELHVAHKPFRITALDAGAGSDHCLSHAAAPGKER